MKVKIFFSNNEIQLQQEINDWFAKNPNISVTEILQSPSADDWTIISIFYIGDE